MCFSSFLGFLGVSRNFSFFFSPAGFCWDHPRLISQTRLWKDKRMLYSHFYEIYEIHSSDAFVHRASFYHVVENIYSKKALNIPTVPSTKSSSRHRQLPAIAALYSFHPHNWEFAPPSSSSRPTIRIVPSWMGLNLEGFSYNGFLRSLSLLVCFVVNTETWVFSKAWSCLIFTFWLINATLYLRCAIFKKKKIIAKFRCVSFFLLLLFCKYHPSQIAKSVTAILLSAYSQMLVFTPSFFFLPFFLQKEMELDGLGSSSCVEIGCIYQEAGIFNLQLGLCTNVIMFIVYILYNEHN